MVNVEKHVLYWRAGAEDDWRKGAADVRAGEIRHGLFWIDLAFEKALKALVTRHTGHVPPRIHSLVDLAEKADLELDSGQRETLRIVSSFQMEGRYPEMQSAIPMKPEALALLAKAEEIFRWLMQQ